MKSVTYLLAHRYLWSRTAEHTISFMMLITGISIFIGAFSLTLITAIMHGFEKTMHEKIQHIHPSATIYSQNPLQVAAISNVIAQEFPAITAISPTAVGHVLVSSPSNQDMQPIVTMLKGINPDQESRVSAIGTKLARSSLPQAVHDNTIIIGKQLAHILGVSIGSPLALFYIEQPQTNQRKVAIQQSEAVVGGIFQTGIDEYDSSVIYCSLPFFETLFPDQGITQIGLSFASHAPINDMVRNLAQRLDLEVHTWQELYPALISALALEKYAMFFILLLITIVASMNIIALIFMFISYKKADIAILRALGMNYAHIQRLFIFMGLSISFFATVCGIAGAWIASIILERYPFIQLPDVYYVSHLPARMNIIIAIIVFFVVLCVTFIASWFATRHIRSINISHVLRFEG